MPLLQAPPIERPCRIDTGLTSCTILLTSDFEALVRELKSACLALGGDPAACQTGE